MPRLAERLFRLILELLPEKAVIDLAVDETLVRRWGPRVMSVGMHRDAVRSGPARNEVTPGRKWVVLSDKGVWEEHAYERSFRVPDPDRG